MFNNNNVINLLLILGQRLKEARLARNETQATFAARIGLTRQSYAKMEKGQGTVPIASWLAASEILGRLDTWNDVLSEKDNLFDQFEAKQQSRKRARRKKA